MTVYIHHYKWQDVIKRTNTLLYLTVYRDVLEVLLRVSVRIMSKPEWTAKVTE